MENQPMTGNTEIDHGKTPPIQVSLEQIHNALGNVENNIDRLDCLLLGSDAGLIVPDKQPDAPKTTPNVRGSVMEIQRRVEQLAGRTGHLVSNVEG